MQNTRVCEGGVFWGEPADYSSQCYSHWQSRPTFWSLPVFLSQISPWPRCKSDLARLFFNVPSWTCVWGGGAILRRANHSSLCYSHIGNQDQHFGPTSHFQSDFSAPQVHKSDLARFTQSAQSDPQFYCQLNPYEPWAVPEPGLAKPQLHQFNYHIIGFRLFTELVHFTRYGRGHLWCHIALMECEYLGHTTTWLFGYMWLEHMTAINEIY